MRWRRRLLRRHRAAALRAAPAAPLFLVAFNPQVVMAIQDATLVRVFRDGLYPSMVLKQGGVNGVTYDKTSPVVFKR